MDFWFDLKKLISIFTVPVSIVLELLLVAFLLMVLSRRRSKKGSAGKSRALLKTGLVVLAIGIVTLYASSTAPVAYSFLAHLERQYEPFSETGEVRDGNDDPQFIVVLAMGQRNARNKPVLSQLTSGAFLRTVGGVDLWNKFPDTSLVFTGGTSETTAMKSVAMRLGVPEASIILESKSRDTKDHAIYVGEIVDDAPFLLVTSGFHMPRAAGLFRKQELRFTPAPVGIVTWAEPGDIFRISGRGMAPKAQNFYFTSTAVHEFMGIFWAKVRGQLVDP